MNRTYVLLVALLLLALAAGLSACGTDSNAQESATAGVLPTSPAGVARTTAQSSASSELTDRDALASPRSRTRRAGTPLPFGATPDASAVLTGTPDVALESPTPSDTPTPLGPTETPTPTPVPTPDEQLAHQIQQVQAKAEDLRDAVRDRDTSRMLRLQQELATDVPKLQAALQGIDAPYASELRLALGDLDGGMSGDVSKLESANRRFDTSLGLKPEESKIQDPRNFAGSLADKIAAFQQAVNANDPGKILSLQKEILGDAATAQQELEQSKSKTAEQIRDALGDVRNGIGGDYGKLNSAYEKLQEAAGRTAQAITPTPIFFPTGTPPPSPTVTRAQEDLQPYTSDLRGKLSKLQELVASGTSDDIAKARDELRAQVAKAQDAVANDQSAQAQRFREALGTAAGAAAGDNTKIADALRQLEAAAKQ